MPLARTYNPATRHVGSSMYDVYRDRAARDSDIREYLPFFYDLARGREQPRIVELGSRKGNSTAAFLAGAEQSGGHVWSGDIEDIIAAYPGPDGMGPWATHPRWTFIQGDDLDPEVQARFPEQFDILLLDASHEYEHVLAELRAYMPRLAAGGVGLFHDTKLYDWVGYGWSGDVPPVQQALDEYCAEAGLSWRESGIDGKYGLGIIGL
jgi:cephalosporin hydroxylase